MRAVICLVLAKEASRKERACEMRFKGLKQENSSPLTPGLLSTWEVGVIQAISYKCALLYNSGHISVGWTVVAMLGLTGSAKVQTSSFRTQAQYIFIEYCLCSGSSV